MEEGRDRPSEGRSGEYPLIQPLPQWRRAEIGPRRYRPRTYIPPKGVPQWRRAEIGPRRRTCTSAGIRQPSPAAMEEGRDRPSEVGKASWGPGRRIAAMEEGRDRRRARPLSVRRNGGGPRSALGGLYRFSPQWSPGGGPRSALGGPAKYQWSGWHLGAAMEEGRDRPSEAPTATYPVASTKRRNGGGPRSALGGRLRRRCEPIRMPAAMEEGRDRPSEDHPSVRRRRQPKRPQWRRAEIGPRRTFYNVLDFDAAMEEGRDRPSEVPATSCQPIRRTRRNGGGPRSALGGVIPLSQLSGGDLPQWRRAEIGPRRPTGAPGLSPSLSRRNGGGPRSALGGPPTPPPSN